MQKTRTIKMSVANQETGQRVNFEEGLPRSSEEEILVYMKIGIFWENIRLTPSCHVEEMALDFVHRKFPNSGLNNSRILNLFIHQGWQLANFWPRPVSHFRKRIFSFLSFSATGLIPFDPSLLSNGMILEVILKNELIQNFSRDDDDCERHIHAYRFNK